MKIIKSPQYIQMPWKNGLGVTHEIERSPAGAEKYDWRLSRADVDTDSAFSVFPGYDRWLVVTEGDGLTLNGFAMEPLVPHHFTGETPIDAKLVGSAVRDLSFIYNREKILAEMKVESFTPNQSRSLDLLEGTYCFYAVNGDVAVAGSKIARGDTAKIELSRDQQTSFEAESSGAQETKIIFIYFKRYPAAQKIL